MIDSNFDETVNSGALNCSVVFGDVFFNRRSQAELWHSKRLPQIK